MESENKRFWIWGTGCVVVLALLIGAAWVARPHYRHFKERREQAQAQAFLARGDYRNALLSAQQTLAINPVNVPACRVMATLADFSRNPATLEYLRRIVQIQPTVENKLLLASAALRYQAAPFPLTQQILEDLAPICSNSATYHVAAATLAIGLQQVPVAEFHFEEAVHLDPTNQNYQLNLAVLRLGTTNETKAAQSRAILEKLRTDATLGSPALRSLLADRLLHKDPEGAMSFSTQLLARTDSTLSDQLQHLGILRQLKSPDFDARLNSLQQQFTTNSVGVAEIASWMQGNGLIGRELQWLTNLPAGMQNQTPVRVSVANAFLQSSNWTGLRDFASVGDWQDMEFLRMALVSRAWSQLGVTAVAESNWGSAINEAGSRYGALTALLDLAQRWNLERKQQDLLKRIFEKFPRERWVQQALAKLYIDNGDTAGLNQFYAKLTPLFPDNVAFKNDLAFTSLLLKTNLPDAYKMAAEVYASNTNEPVAVSTYAFGLYVQGKTSDGLTVLRHLSETSLRRPDTALYYGVLLAASGAPREAAPYLKIAATNTNLLPEERGLLSAARGH